MHMKGEPMAGKENREIKNSVFVDLFYEDESAEAYFPACTAGLIHAHERRAYGRKRKQRN